MVGVAGTAVCRKDETSASIPLGGLEWESKRNRVGLQNGRGHSPSGVRQGGRPHYNSYLIATTSTTLP